MASFLARAISAFLALTLVARFRGPSELGVYQFALTLSLTFSFAVGFGLSNFLTREVARRFQDSRAWIECGLFVALTAGTVVTVGLVGVVRLLDQPSAVVTAVLLCGVALAFDTASLIGYAAFEGWQRMELETIATWLEEGMFAVGTVAVLRAGYGVTAVLVIYLGSRVLGAMTAWVIASRELRCLLVPRPRFLRSVLPRTVPFALDDAFSYTYIKIDTVMLGFINGTAAVGLYSAGTNLVLNFNILARGLNAALYPRMSRAWPDVARLGRYRDASLRVLGAVGVPITIASALLAPRIFHILYGRRFDPGVLTYQILALVIVIRMLGHTLGTSLTAANRQAQRTTVVTVAAVGNVLMNLWVLPRYSYLGAAFTTSVTELGVFLAYALLVRRFAGRSALAGALALPALCSIPMGATLVALRNAGLLVSVGMASATYLAAAVLVAALLLPADERDRVRAILGNALPRLTGARP